MKRECYADRCCVCGRFVSRDADFGLPYGTADDTEPPDPELFCPKCAKWEYDEAVAPGGYLLDIWWSPPDWAIRAREALRQGGVVGEQAMSLVK